MEVTKEAIIEALGKNPGLIIDLMPTIEGLESYKTIFNAKAKEISDARAADVTKSIHGMYDEQFLKRGYSAGTKEGGNKEKTYEVLERVFGDLEALKQKESSLNADSRIVELQAKVDRFTKEGEVAKHFQSMIDSLKESQEQEVEGYKNQIQTLQENNINFQKRTDIDSAYNSLILNPEIDQTIAQIVLSQAKDKMQNMADVRDNQVVYLDAEGKVLMNKSTYKPMTATEVINTIPEVAKIIKDDSPAPGGGGAEPTIVGKIETTSVEGKGTTQRLLIDKSSYSTKGEFYEAAEQAMFASGKTMESDDWNTLIDAAAVEHNIESLEN